MTEEAADEATDSLEGFLEDLPGTRADLPAEVEVRIHFLLIGHASYLKHGLRLVYTIKVSLITAEILRR